MYTHWRSWFSPCLIYKKGFCFFYRSSMYIECTFSPSSGLDEGKGVFGIR